MVFRADGNAADTAIEAPELTMLKTLTIAATVVATAAIAPTQAHPNCIFVNGPSLIDSLPPSAVMVNPA